MKFNLKLSIFPLILFLTISFLSFLSIQAQVVTKTYNFASPITVDGNGSYAYTAPGLEFVAADFGNGCEVSNVSVSIRFQKTDGTCGTPGTGNAFHNETSFSVSNPGNSTILATPGTWSGAAVMPITNVTFDQLLGTVTPSGTPVAGVFLPNGGNLNVFNGNSGLGVWNLMAGDNAGGDPLCIHGYSVSLTTLDDVAPPLLSCPANITVTETLGGTTVNFPVPTATDNCGRYFGDNFENGINPELWPSAQGVTVSSVCGSYSGNGLFFIGSSIRVAETLPLDVTAGGTISFYAKTGNPASGGICDTPEPGEELLLQYSTNGGNTFLNALILSVTSFDTLTLVSTTIPSGAFTSSTIFRFIQNGAPSPNEDQWMIDNLRIEAEIPVVQTSGLASGSLFPSGTTSNSFTAYDTYGNFSNCSFTVSVIQTDTIPPTITCPNNLTLDVEADMCEASTEIPLPTYSDNIGVATLSSSYGPIAGAFSVLDTTLGSFTGPSHVDLADLDNDGDQDVVVADFTGDRIYIIENLGNGAFGTANIVATPDGPYITVADDLNGDSLPDLVSANYNDQQVKWYPNQGNLTFGSGFVLQSSYVARAVHITDLNGDGLKEIIAIDQTNGLVTRFMNNGGNVFSSGNPITAGLTNPFFIESGDFNNDTHPDLVVSLYSSPGLLVLLNSGTGTSYIQLNLNTTWANLRKIHVADVDMDGWDDILATMYSNDRVYWYKNNGNNTFTENLIASNIDGPFDIYYSDVTGDSLPDILVAQQTTGQISYFENLGNATFNLRQTLFNNYFGPFTITGADIGNDGDNDLFTTDFNGGTVRFHEIESNSIDTFQVGNYPITYTATDSAGNSSSCTFSIIVRDTLFPDLTCPEDATVTTDSGECKKEVGIFLPLYSDNCPGLTISTSFNLNPPTNLIEKNNIESFSDPRHQVVSFDADLDGDNDVITGTEFDLFYSENLGNGQFAPRVHLENFNFFKHMEVMDCDNDQDLDLVIIGGPFPLSWMENVGNGSFLAPQTIGDPNDNHNVMAIGDFNNDSLMDIAAHSNLNQRLVWYQNMGNGTFSSANLFPNTFAYSDAMTTGDINNDGNLDVVAALTSSFPASIYYNLNLGNGTFANQTFIGSGLDGVWEVLTGDLNGDSYTDIIVNPLNTDDVFWYFNEQDNTFSPRLNLVSNANVYDLELFDLDGNGNLDVLIATENSAVTNIKLTWYRNLGGASFVPRLIDGFGKFRSVAIADIDGDLAPDVVAALHDSTKVNWYKVNQLSTDSLSIGNHTFNTTVTDASGNVSTCSFSIEVESGSGTIGFTCPSDITQSTDSGICEATVTYPTPSGPSECGGITTMISGLGSGLKFPVGTTVESYLYDNGFGDSTFCTFNVIITDDKDPVIICPADITVNLDTVMNCDTMIQYNPPSVTDNCTGVQISRISGLASGMVFPTGSSLVRFAAEDGSGNTDSCEFHVVIVDTVPLQFTCPPNIAAFADAQTCEAIVNYPTPNILDNCISSSVGTPYLAVGQPSGNSFPIGIHLVSYGLKVGNSFTGCSFLIAVTDSIAPAVTCPGNIITSTDSGLCTAIVTYSPIIDECTSFQTQFNGLGSGGTFPIGASTEVITATDASNLSANCSFTVTVQDQENPIAVCQDLTVTLDVNNMATLSPQQVDNGSTDNCGIDSMSLSQSVFNTSNLGLNTVTLSVWDEAGNPSDCQANITVFGNCNADALEPNNTLSTASGLSNGLLGLTGKLYICDDLDEDWFKVPINTNQQFLKIFLTGLPANYDVELYDAQQSLLASSNNTGTINDTIYIQQLNAGMYFIRVFGVAGAWNPINDYKLLVSKIMLPPVGITKPKPNTPFIKAGADEYLEIFPVPSSGSLTVRFGAKESQAIKYELFDLTGKRVHHGAFEAMLGENLFQLDLSLLTNGTYLLKAKGKTGNWAQKVIILTK